jgi:hypothetical protein
MLSLDSEGGAPKARSMGNAAVENQERWPARKEDGVAAVAAEMPVR